MGRRKGWTLFIVLGVLIGASARAQALDGGLPTLDALPDLGTLPIEPQLDLAVSGGTLLLRDVLRSVQRAYPLVEAARAEARAAQAQARGASGAFDPRVRGRATRIPLGQYPYTRADLEVVQPTPFRGAEFFGGWRYGQGSIPDYYGELRTLSLGEFRAGLNLPLWRNGSIDKARAALNRTRLGEEIAEQGVVEAQLKAARDGAQRYWEWVAAGQRVQVVQELIGIARVRDVAIARRVEQGDIPELDRTENLRALLQREGQLVASERDLQEAALALSLYLRNETGQPVVPSREWLPAAFPEAEPVEALVGGVRLEAVLARHPELRQLSRKREQLAITRELAENQTAPLIDLVVGVSKDVGEGVPARGRPQLETGLTLELPTLNRVATGEERAAQAALARADAQLQLEREVVAVEVRDAVSAVAAARIRIDVAQREAEFASRLVEGEERRFKLGDTTLLFVNLREQQVVEARLRVVEALSDYFKAVAALRAALVLPQSGLGETSAE